MTKMLEDLEELSRVTDSTNPGWLRTAESGALHFLKEHHATIAQNAEDSKRLKALELALAEFWASHKSYEVEQVVTSIEKRADEIMRGNE